MTAPRTLRRPRDTHFIFWDEPGKYYRRALCGKYVRKDEHSNEPTCPTCAARLAEHERSVGP